METLRDQLQTLQSLYQRSTPPPRPAAVLSEFERKVALVANLADPDKLVNQCAFEPGFCASCVVALHRLIGSTFTFHFARPWRCTLDHQRRPACLLLATMPSCSRACTICTTRSPHRIAHTLHSDSLCSRCAIVFILYLFFASRC